MFTEIFQDFAPATQRQEHAEQEDVQPAGSGMASPRSRMSSIVCRIASRALSSAASAVSPRLQLIVAQHRRSNTSKNNDL